MKCSRYSHTLAPLHSECLYISPSRCMIAAVFSISPRLKSRGLEKKGSCLYFFATSSHHPVLHQVWTMVRTFLGICLLGFISAFRNGSCGPTTTTCLKCKPWKGWSLGKNLWVVLCQLYPHPPKEKMFMLGFLPMDLVIRFHTLTIDFSLDFVSQARKILQCKLDDWK